MTLGLYESRKRRRQQVQWTMAKWALALVAILGAGLFAYESGTRLTEREVSNLRDKVAELAAEIDRLQQRQAEAQATIHLAQQRLEETEKRYAEVVPTGALAALLARTQERLDAGVRLDRLQFLIDAAENTRSCDESPATKRFVVRTPFYRGANDSVSFGNKTITVTADGQLATNALGKTEAWFDPAQPVTVHFTQVGGKTTDLAGKLPLHRSIVIGEFEHRFSVIAGPRGFVQVTGERCQYP